MAYKYSKHVDYQKDPVKGWLWMSLYWLICLSVSSRYLMAPVRWIDWRWLLLAISFAFQAQRTMDERHDSCGRLPCVPAAIVFAALNGTLETCMFAFVYDSGKGLAMGSHSLPWLGTLLGYALFFIYSGLIHALFWEPYALPLHVKPDLPPFLTHALPALVAHSLVLIGLYELSGSVWLSCAIHVCIDLRYAIHIAL